jgi:hypothetical protein
VIARQAGENIAHRPASRIGTNARFWRFSSISTCCANVSAALIVSSESNPPSRESSILTNLTKRLLAVKSVSSLISNPNHFHSGIYALVRTRELK